LILKSWIKAGIKSGDVALLVDIDGVPSRDFLQAIKTCDFPEYEDTICKYPKIICNAISFEGSPECIKKKRWYHPEFILGKCLEGVGNSEGRVKPERVGNLSFTQRLPNWHGGDNVPDIVKEIGKWPLFNLADMRTAVGSKKLYGGEDYACYHFHNWFDSLETLRRKYRTYGHVHSDIYKKTLSEIKGDVDIMVRCARNITNEAADKKAKNLNEEKGVYFEVRNLIEEKYAYLGVKPIFFQDKTYKSERHTLLLQLIKEDEERYGSSYDSNAVKEIKLIQKKIEVFKKFKKSARAMVKKKKNKVFKKFKKSARAMVKKKKNSHASSGQPVI